MKQKTINFSNGAQNHELTINHDEKNIINVVCKPAIHGFTPKQFISLAMELAQAFEKIQPGFTESLSREMAGENKTVGDSGENQPEKKNHGSVGSGNPDADQV